MLYMPDVGKECHIFLQAISNLVGRIWYKQNVNVSKGVLSSIVTSMAAKVGLMVTLLTSLVDLL
jgi:hypothetical protein